MTEDMLRLFAADARRRADAGYYSVLGGADRRAPSLAKAVLSAPRAIVAELKPAAPASGPLRGISDAAALAGSLVAAGARAVSVLTDPDHFAGRLDTLASVAGTGAPTLMKDFVVDERQLDAAAAQGASAVLLVLPLHERGFAWTGAAEAVEAAHARGLETLLEVWDAEGFRAAARTATDLVGVNNRNLSDLSLDPSRFERVLAEVSKDRPVLALSGVSDAGGARRMFAAGADGVLVGSAIMRAADPAAKVKELVAA